MDFVLGRGLQRDLDPDGSGDIPVDLVQRVKEVQRFSLYGREQWERHVSWQQGTSTSPIKDPCYMAPAVCMRFLLAIARGEHWSSEFSRGPLPVGVLNTASGKGKGAWQEGGGTLWPQGTQFAQQAYTFAGPPSGTLPLGTQMVPIGPNFHGQGKGRS